MLGAFARSDDAVEAAQTGNTVLIVPSYSDDAEQIAAALQARQRFAVLSTHHVFGGPRATWDQGWAHTRAWIEPFVRRGIVAAVYVVDEPLHNGIPASTRDEAIGIVRAAGFRTMVAEWIEPNALRAARPPVDYYGVTCYDWPGYGAWTLERCREAYRTHPDWNIVIGQGFDLQRRNGTPAQQVQAWREIAQGRAGLLFWVWRWPGQTGIADDPALLAAFRALG
jgi:hypothetical protein